METSTNTENQGKATTGHDDLLENILKDLRQKAKRNPILLHSFKKWANLTKFQHRRFVYASFEACLERVHEDYKPERDGILIRPSKRDRKKYFESERERERFQLNDIFMQEIVAKSTDVKSHRQVLRMDSVLNEKTTESIKTEMKITEISPNDILERVIQYGSQCYWNTIVGYCEGLTVFVVINTKGKIQVSALKCSGVLKGDKCSFKVLSKDVPHLVY